MADNISELTTPYFTDGSTQLNAQNLNPIVAKINEVIRKVNGGVTPTQTVATPTISISGSAATISCSTSGATIYYTTNGNTPTTSSTQYSSPITLSGACTIKAIAVKSGMTNSQIASAEYNPSATVQPPTIYIRDLAIIMAAESGATIYYTTDGSTPTANSTQYTGAFTSATNIASLKAIAVKNGSSSSVASASFTAPQTSTIMAPTVVIEGNKATVLSNGAESLLQYSLDGSNYNTYTEPITLTGEGNVYARTRVADVIINAIVAYTGDSSIRASIRYDSKISPARIKRADCTDSTLVLDIPPSGTYTVRFFPIVSGRKYVFKGSLNQSAYAYWGYASQALSELSETTTISGKYDSDTIVPASATAAQVFTVVAENYPYIAAGSTSEDKASTMYEIIKE